MTGFRRSPFRSIFVLLAVTAATAATLAIAPSSALAGSKGGCNQEGSYARGYGDCPVSAPDACPDMAGMQQSAAECVAPAPAPAPAPTPAATPEPTPTPAASIPDEGYIAAPPTEFEHGSLTIQTAQADPPATTGEVVLTAAGAGDMVADAPGSGTSAAVLPSGELPYTGARTIDVAIAGVSLLWIGSLSFLLAAAVRRRVSVEG